MHVSNYLDNTGRADGEDSLDEIRATLKAQQVTLEVAAPILARDYYTEEEMVCLMFKTFAIFSIVFVTIHRNSLNLFSNSKLIV